MRGRSPAKVPWQHRAVPPLIPQSMGQLLLEVCLSSNSDVESSDGRAVVRARTEKNVATEPRSIVSAVEYKELWYDREG